MPVGGSGVRRLRQAKRAKARRLGNPFSKAKAKKILKEKNPTLRGKSISKKQRGLLGVIASGKKPSRLKK